MKYTMETLFLLAVTLCAALMLSPQALQAEELERFSHREDD